MNAHRATRRGAAGFTIIEFMIAMTLSLLVLAALTAAFVANSRSRAEIERANQQMENGRFALQLLSDDLQLAGYLSHFNPFNAAATLTLPAAKPNPCDTTIASIDAALLLHVQGYDSPAGLDTSLDDCLADHKTGTDIVVVRRVATCAVGAPNCGAVANAPYFQASLCANENELGDPDNNALLFYDLDSNLANLTRTQRDCATDAEHRQYLTHIYYVANNDQAGDGIPTLKRAELTRAVSPDDTSFPDGGFEIVPLAHGIENLQIEYGIDTDGSGVPWSGDGIPNVFTASPDRYNRANPASPQADCAANAANCLRNWGDVMAMRLNVLARNITPSQDHTDTKVYQLGLAFDGTANCARDENDDGTCEAFNDRIKRHVYQTSVKLNNPSGRRI